MEEHLAKAEKEIRSVLRWIENDIEAGDDMISIHRNALYAALDELAHAKSAGAVV